jgi:hypothetical protein
MARICNSSSISTPTLPSNLYHQSRLALVACWIYALALCIGWRLHGCNGSRVANAIREQCVIDSKSAKLFNEERFAHSAVHCVIPTLQQRFPSRQPHRRSLFQAIQMYLPAQQMRHQILVIFCIKPCFLVKLVVEYVSVDRRIRAIVTTAQYMVADGLLMDLVLLCDCAMHCV